MLISFLHRPWHHHLIIALYGLFSFLYLGLLIWTAPEEYYNGKALMMLFDLVWYNQFFIIGGPLFALGLYIRHWASYCLYMLHCSSWLIIVLWYLSSVDTPILSVVFGISSCFLAFFVIFSAHKDIYYPYFHRIRRFFRRSKRLDIWHAIHVNGNMTITNSLSIGGCYIKEKDPHELSIDQITEVVLKGDRFVLHCLARVVHISDDGYGLEFQSLNRLDRRMIQLFIKNRSFERVKVKIPASINIPSNNYKATILDISEVGCFLESPDGNLVNNEPAKLVISLNDSKYEIPSMVVWSKKSSSEKYNLGMRFLKKQHDLMDSLHNDHQGLHIENY